LIEFEKSLINKFKTYRKKHDQKFPIKELRKHPNMVNTFCNKFIKVHTRSAKKYEKLILLNNDENLNNSFSSSSKIIIFHDYVQALFNKLIEKKSRKSRKNK